MIFPIKTENEILNEMMAELQASTGITNFNPGSIARSLLEVFNRKLHSYYEYFDVYSAMLFVSTSEGPYLDLLGEILNCARNGNEDDENYRYRICNQVFLAAKANETAVRLRCLAVSGVKDVVITKYSRGSGSFTIHVLTDEIDTPSDVLANVKTAVTEVVAEGVKVIISKPRIVPIDIAFTITLQSKGTSTTSIASQIKVSIQDYLDSLDMGSSVSIVKIEALATANESLSKAFITSMKADGSQVVIRDIYTPDWDQRLYVRDIALNIIE